MPKKIDLQQTKDNLLFLYYALRNDANYGIRNYGETPASTMVGHYDVDPFIVASEIIEKKIKMILIFMESHDDIMVGDPAYESFAWKVSADISDLGETIQSIIDDFEWEISYKEEKGENFYRFSFAKQKMEFSHLMALKLEFKVEDTKNDS